MFFQLIRGPICCCRIPKTMFYESGNRSSGPGGQAGQECHGESRACESACPMAHDAHCEHNNGKRFSPYCTEFIPSHERFVAHPLTSVQTFELCRSCQRLLECMSSFSQMLYQDLNSLAPKMLVGRQHVTFLASTTCT